MPACRSTGFSDNQITRLLRTLPTPEPPPWLYARVQTAILADQRRKRMCRRGLFALATVLHLLVFAQWERGAR